MTDLPSLGVSHRSRIVAILSLTLLVMGYLLWSIFGAYRAQEDAQRVLAAHSVRDVSQEVYEMMEERHESIALLAQIEGTLLSRLAAHPEDEALQQQLRDLLDFRFNDFYSFTLATPDGALLIDDFGETVGDLCRADLRHFAETGRQRSIIHPGPSAYHYDVMSKWAHGGREGILFVSFVSDHLAQWLSHNETPGHRLLMVRTDQPRLIEVTQAGSRDRLGGNNFLDDAAMARIRELGASAPVAGSAWTVMDLPDAALMSEAWRRTVWIMVGTGLVSLLVGAIAVWAVIREARRAGELERERRKGREDLERRVVERTREMWKEKDFADAILGAAGNVIVVLDLEGRVVRFNRAAEETTGYTFEELRGQPIWDYLIPPDRRADVRWVFDSLVHDKLVGTYENEWFIRDGSRRLFDWRNTVLRDEQGRISHVVAQGSDITERKEAESQLRRDKEQQASLRALLEAVLKGTALEETLGHCLDILLSVSWLSLLPKGGVFLTDQEAGRLRLAVQRNLSPGLQAVCARIPVSQCVCERDAEACQLQYTDCVGALHEIPGLDRDEHGHCSVPILFNEQVLGVLVLYLPAGFQRDVAREEFIAAAVDILAGFICRKMDEQALRESEAKANLILDSAPDAMLVVGADGTVARANDNALAMFGYSREALIGLKIEDLMPERFRAGHRPIRTRYMEHPEARPMGIGRDLYGLSSSGEEFPLEVSLAPLGKDGGNQIIVTLVDITQRKRDEIQLRRYAQIVETSGDLLCLLDRDECFQVVNPAYAAMFGGSPRTLVGKHVGSLLGPEMYAEIKPHLDAVMAGGDRHFTIERVFPDGRRYVLDAEYRPFWVENEMQGIVASIRDVTEQVEAEAAAQEADRLFRDTMEASFMGIYIIQDQEFRYVNPSYAELFGYTPEELEGRMGPLDLVIPEQRGMVAENLKLRVEGEPGRPYELKGVRKDGSTLDILVWGKGILYKGAPALVGTLLDISERKRVEEALRESEQILERAQAMAHLGSWTADVAAQTFTSSTEARRILGQDTDTIPWERAFAAFHPEDHALGTTAWRRALAGEPLDVEHRIVVGGKTKWIHVKAEVIFDEAGQPSRANGMVQDITEVREAQRALEAHRHHLEELVAARTADLIETEAKAKLILESTADGLFGMDMEGRFTFINPAACAMLGYAPETLLGQRVHETIHHSCVDGESFGADRCPMMVGLGAGRQVRVDTEAFWRVDGSAFPVAYALQPMYKDGRLVGAVVSFMDITRRRETEAARETALAEAERLARVRSEFLANMSHEIRTPLNAVLGLAQVGLKGSKGRRSLDTFARILDSGQLLLGVVNDILDFSKVEAGRLELEQRLFSPTEVMDRVVSVVAARVYGKGLDFKLEESEDLPEACMGDELRLSQILMNLLTNAVKFTERGRITLRVSREEGNLVFSVEDTGIGIDAAHLDRLFIPFEQADGSTTRRFGGTGLGLAISKRLVELMQGELLASSQPGEGSVFVVRIPMALGAARPVVHTGHRVALLGLQGEEADTLTRALEAWGVGIVDAAEHNAPAGGAELLVCAQGAAGQGTAAWVDRAVDQGTRVALVVTPGGDAAQEAWREEVSILERPLRARHVLAILESSASTLARPSGGGQRLAGLAVLAAEDNEVNQVVLREMLESEGARLTCLDNGREAVDELARKGAGFYDIMLTDIQMPVMDGYEATLAAHALDPALPVIGITAHAMAEEKARCLAVGMVEHLPKPLELGGLVAGILRHTRSPPRPRPGQATMPRIAFEASAPPADGPGEAHKKGEEAMDVSIDWTQLEARFNGKREFVNRLVKTAIDSQRESPARLRAAAASGDYQAMAFVAHSLKGMSGNLMAGDVHALAARVETAAKGQEEDALGLAEFLARAMERLLVVMADRIR